MKAFSRPAFSTWFRTAAAGLAVLALGACAGSPPELGNAGGKLVVAPSLPEPDQLTADGEAGAFRLGADDLLAVKVFGHEDASVERVRVDKSGRVSLPIAGVIEAGGMTLAELNSEIETRLKRSFFRNPLVSVNLLEVESAKVTVDGQVTRPGVYPAFPNMTLMQAVASAQGATQTARLNEVVIFRTNKGQRYAALYDLRAIRRGNYEDPRVFADDIVLVGDSSARRLFQDFIAIIPLLTTPLIVAFQK
jgi:polysaccharide biosynthesis/export protein